MAQSVSPIICEARSQSRQMLARVEALLHVAGKSGSSGMDGPFSKSTGDTKVMTGEGIDP